MSQFFITIQVILPVLFPVICGLVLLFCQKKINSKKRRNQGILAVMLFQLLLVILAWQGKNQEVIFWNLTKDIPVLFKIDGMSILFTGLLTIVWMLVGVFSFEYMKHEEETEHIAEHTRSLSGATFYGFYLMVLGVMTGVGFAGNLVTFYLFYEFMTLLSMPFVLHTMTKEAIFAAKKYLFYSIAGASFALFGFAFLYSLGGSIQFVEGGIFAKGLPVGKEGILLLSAFFMIIGFGTKAGMFPMHAWLPSAHPVAPAPASAVLSGVITKTGVLGIIRVVFYLFGVKVLLGTWVQYAFLSLSLITVFMGSMLAYKEIVLKKRLAYSTVSQVSYVLFGIALMHPVALFGSLLHMVCHSIIKCTLFLDAGAIIYKTEKTKVKELIGIGKEMSITMWTFTIASLGLVGIPPMCGFISKWYLCQGALESGMVVVKYLGPAILLISALLTAGYLFSIVIMAFFPGEDFDYTSLKKQKLPICMLVSLIAFAILIVFFGIWPEGLLSMFTEFEKLLF